jgi:uncharacterized protein (DUF983 family)
MDRGFEQPSAAKLLGRASLLRCPFCGERGVLVSWFKLAPQCSRCGLKFERGEADYFTGSMLLNLVAVEVLFAVGVLVGILATWPDPAWKTIFYAGLLFMTVAPFALYPFSKTLWLAIDLIFRPRNE